LPGPRPSLTLFFLFAACSGFPGSSPEPRPAPAAEPPPLAAPAPATSDSLAVISDSLTTPVRAQDVTPLSDSLFERQQAADSAADVAVLEKLAEAHAPAAEASQAGDPLDVLSEGRGALSGLDLSTYAEHDRVKYYLDFFQGPARSRMAVWLTRLPRYEPMVRERFERESLPGDLIYLGLIESGYSNRAVSRSRAVGMWQFMRGTARWMGLRVDRWVDERRDPIKATDAAARYLSHLTQRFGSYYLAAAAYNGGPGRVSRGLERVIPALATAEVTDVPADEDPGEEGPGWSDADFFILADTRYLRPETKDYVPKLIAAALIARNPTAFGFDSLPDVPAYPRDSIVVSDMTGLDVIAELAGATLAELRELNPHFLRLATPPGRSVVRLPAGTMEKVGAGYATLPASKRVRYGEHFVRRGETLSGIARRYRVSVADLRSVNPSARRSSMIRVGQRLVIPTPGGAGAARFAAEDDADAPRASGGVHQVRPGETLGAIARRYRVTVSQLQAWNGIRDARSLKAGQRLAVRARPRDRSAVAVQPPGRPSVGVRSHLVRRGETLSGLARRYGVSVQALLELNGLSSARRLQAGRRIKIPA